MSKDKLVALWKLMTDVFLDKRPKSHILLRKDSSLVKNIQAEIYALVELRLFSSSRGRDLNSRQWRPRTFLKDAQPTEPPSHGKFKLSYLAPCHVVLRIA